MSFTFRVYLRPVDQVGCSADVEESAALQAYAPGPMLSGSQGLLPRWASAFLPSGEGPAAAPVGSCFSTAC